MALTQSTTGRYGNATVLGTPIGITGWNLTITKDFDDSTDSNNYDPITQQVWRSQAPGVVGCDGSVEGNFDLAGSTDTNFVQKFKTDGPYAATFGITRSVSLISGNFDFLNIRVTTSVPGATMVTFSADVKSNGIPTLP